MTIPDSVPQSHRSYLELQDFPLPVGMLGFTEGEIAAIRRFGHWLDALATRIIEPYNEMQRHFVDVCNNIGEPIFKYERVWLRVMWLMSDSRRSSIVVDRSSSWVSTGVWHDGLNAKPRRDRWYK